jgi:hypothetical protein
MGAVTILIVMLILVALSVGGYFVYQKFFSKSSARKYSTVYSKDKIKGACGPEAGTGVSATATKSSECATACDAATTPCLGYDWDGSSGCTLYATLPTTATTPISTTDKNECRALSK